MKLNFEKNDGYPPRYKTHPSQKGDPLYEKSPSGVVFGKGKKRIFDENMVPFGELKDQDFGQENDPEKTFVPIEKVADPDSLNGFDFEIENSDVDTGNEKIDEDGDNKVEYPEEKDLREVLINGIPLGDIMDGKVSEDELPQRPIKEGFNHIEKINVNRDEKTNRDIIVYGKKGQSYKTKRMVRSLNAKKAKQLNPKTKSFKPHQKLQRLINKGDDPRMTG